MQITAADILRFFEIAAVSVAEQRDSLTLLDTPIGDADHGLHLNRGLTAVRLQLSRLVDPDIGTILCAAGAALVVSVGGASGPLYGTGFVRAGLAIGNRHSMGLDELILMADAALAGVRARGGAPVGAKTMIDAAVPMIEELKTARNQGADLREATRRAVQSGEAGMWATVAMRASHGRAAYLGERSIGHQDPGATSLCLLARAFLEVVERVAVL
jgi:dihydroxyacetone kinase-like protein